MSKTPKVQLNTDFRVNQGLKTDFRLTQSLRPDFRVNQLKQKLISGLIKF